MLGFLFLMNESKVKEAEKSTELESSIWSVISFDRCEASGLSYKEAIAKIIELDSQRVSGLCIVTDDAASRVV